jgi:hypothetical protein
MLAAYTMHREWIGVGSDRSVDGDEELLHIDCHRPHQAEVGHEQTVAVPGWIVDNVRLTCRLW